MKIVVLLKQVPDTEEERRLDPATGILERETGESVMDEINERALEVALSYKDLNKECEVVLLSMGPDGVKTALRKGLQMGADSAVHVSDGSLAGADAVQTATVLAASLRETGFDLVVAGDQSTDGRGGVVPAMVSELLGLPMLGSLDEIQVLQDSVTGNRREEHGSSTVRASLPALISVTERAAEARFPSFKGIMKAKSKPMNQLTLGDIPTERVTAATARSRILATSERPPRTAGVKIFDEGDAGVKLAEFLTSGRLV